MARAAQCLKAGLVDEAIWALREASRLRPGDALVQNDLGAACLQAGRLPEAIAAFREAVAANPRFAKAFLRMGLALEAQGNAEAAIRAYHDAARVQPSLTEAQFRAGNLLEILGQAAQAATAFRRAASSASKSPLGRIAAARLFVMQGREPEAERALRHLLALDPANAMAQDLLGNILVDVGRFAEARACFSRAIAAAPLLAGSYYDLVRCRPLGADDACLVARMRASLAQPGLDAAQRVRVHLALGKALDDFGDPAAAMRAFAEADALRRAIAPFDAHHFDEQVARVVALFTPERIARAAGLGSRDATPVFILGLPRSGTTLVEQVVSSHPDVAAGGELPFWEERGPAWDPAGPAAADASFLDAAIRDYGDVLRGIGRGAARVTDKMPPNLFWAGLIHLAFPRATILHCERDALDTAVSIHQTHFNPRRCMPTGGEALVGYVQAHRRLARHWRTVLPADRFVDVRYETLVGDPATEIRRIVAACGLGWDAACLAPERNARSIRTPSKWQARQPIHSGAVGRWRRYEPWLGPLAALAGQD